MKKFNFTGTVKITVYTEVEAETLEEAMKIAEERADEIDKAHWKDVRVTDMWLCDDFDGMVQDITLNK